MSTLLPGSPASNYRGFEHLFTEGELSYEAVSNSEPPSSACIAVGHLCVMAAETPQEACPQVQIDFEDSMR